MMLLIEPSNHMSQVTSASDTKTQNHTHRSNKSRTYRVVYPFLTYPNFTPKWVGITHGYTQFFTYPTNLFDGYLHIPIYPVMGILRVKGWVNFCPIIGQNSALPDKYPTIWVVGNPFVKYPKVSGIGYLT